MCHSGRVKKTENMDFNPSAKFTFGDTPTHEIPIFPQIKAGNAFYSSVKRPALCIETRIRMLGKDNKYYLCVVRRHAEIGSTTIPEVFKHFMFDLYFMQMCGVVDPDLSLDRMNPEKKAFELDPDQTPEPERVKKMLEL